MKHKRMIGLLCTLLVITGCTQSKPVKKKKPKKVVHIEEPVLNTDDVSALCMDYDSKKIYYAKNEQESRYPASTIKLLSALVAIDYYKDSDVLTTKNIESLPDRVFIHTSPVYDNEKIPFKDVIHGMLLKSSNEMALTLAENYKGGYNAFIKEMNKKAKQLGCQKVDVTNPHGLSYADKGWLKETCSTKDMAIIARAFYKNKKLRNIITTKEYTFETNSNRWMKNVSMTRTESSTYDPRVLGGKTGFTNLAGRCLVTFSKVKKRTIITVVFKENSRKDTCTDTKKLLDYTEKVLAAN